MLRLLSLGTWSVTWYDDDVWVWCELVDAKNDHESVLDLSGQLCQACLMMTMIYTSERIDTQKYLQPTRFAFLLCLHPQQWPSCKHRLPSLDVGWRLLTSPGWYLTKKGSSSSRIYLFSLWGMRQGHRTSYMLSRLLWMGLHRTVSRNSTLQTVMVRNFLFDFDFLVLFPDLRCKPCSPTPMDDLRNCAISSWNRGHASPLSRRHCKAHSTSWIAQRFIHADTLGSSSNISSKGWKDRVTTCVNSYLCKRVYFAVPKRSMQPLTSSVTTVHWGRRTTRTSGGPRNKGMILNLLCISILLLPWRKHSITFRPGKRWQVQWRDISSHWKMSTTGSWLISCSLSSTHPRDLLGPAGIGKTPIANAMCTSASSYWQHEHGVNNAIPRFKSGNNLDFFRAEPGSIFVPAILDDGNMAMEAIMAMKAFLDVSGGLQTYHCKYTYTSLLWLTCLYRAHVLPLTLLISLYWICWWGEDSRLYCRWGAAFFVQFQYRVVCGNTFDTTAESLA